MVLKRLVSLALLGAALSACSTFEAMTGANVGALRATQASGGTAFTRALTEEYLALAAFEADEMFDHGDADHFARKGLRAADGEAVLPEEPGDPYWSLPGGAVAEARGVRTRLVDLLDAGRRDDMPATAARAQSRFDCWVEQWEENFQDTHIATCRQDLFLALQQMEAVVEEPAPPPPQPEPLAAAPAPVPDPTNYLCFFDFDSAEVDLECREVVSLVTEDLATYSNPAIAVEGHTDTSGSSAYNLRLSTRRADNVLNEMIAQGIARDLVDTVGARGEEVLRVPTPDETRERENRRVEITVRQRLALDIFEPTPVTDAAPPPIRSANPPAAPGDTGGTDPSDPFGLRGLEPYLDTGNPTAARSLAPAPADPSDPFGLRGLEPYLGNRLVPPEGSMIPPPPPPAAEGAPAPLSTLPDSGGTNGDIAASLARTERLLADLVRRPDRIQEALAVSRAILDRYQ